MKKLLFAIIFVFLMIPFVTAYSELNISTFAQRNNEVYIRYDSNWLKVMQSFTSPTDRDIVGVNVTLQRLGSPTGLANITLQTFSNGNATGTLVCAGGKGTKDVSTISTSWTNYNILFTSPCTITAGTTYAIVLDGTFTVSTSNLYFGGRYNVDSYANGYSARYITSTYKTTGVGGDLTLSLITDSPTPTANYFKLYAYNEYGNASIGTFNATINGTFYSGTGGVITTTIENRNSTSINITVRANNYLSRTFENQSVGTDKNYQLYPVIRLYAENKYTGTQLSVFSAELDGYKNFSTTNVSLKTDTALIVKNYNITLTASDYTPETIELDSLTISTNGTYKFNMTPYIRLYAEDFYNGTKLNTFTAEIDGYKNFSTTNGSLKTDTSIAIKNYNISVKANNYFINTSELNSLTISSNGTKKLNLTPYTMIRAKAYSNASLLNSFSVNWTTSGGTTTSNTTTNGRLYLPLYNDVYNATIYNILDDGGYARQSQTLTANPYLKAYNFSLYTAQSIYLRFKNETTNNVFPENKSISINK